MSHLFVRCLLVTVKIIDNMKLLIVSVSMDRKTSVNGSLECSVVGNADGQPPDVFILTVVTVIVLNFQKIVSALTL